MQLLPHLSLQLINTGWFSLLYGILCFSIIIFLPKERKKRIFTFPKSETKLEKVLSGLSLFLFGRGLIFYSFFIPLKIFTLNFYVGTVIYLIVIILSCHAIWIFSHAELSKPVTKGIYKITRHPIQILSIIMWIGIGIASGTWLMIIFAVLLGIVSYPSLKAQEKFCTNKYGKEYLEYLNRTPRYLFF